MGSMKVKIRDDVFGGVAQTDKRKRHLRQSCYIASGALTCSNGAVNRNGTRLNCFTQRLCSKLRENNDRRGSSSHGGIGG